MNLNVELYASLTALLPPGNHRFRRQMSFADDTTVQQVIDHFGISAQDAHLVLANGKFVCGEDRRTHRLSENDTVSVWPPVAGG